jgi:hypothetical protein
MNPLCRIARENTYTKQNDFFRWTLHHAHWHTGPTSVGVPSALHRSLTILGSGYTAKFLLPLAERRYGHVFATSRDPVRHLGHLPSDQRVHFDLAKPETWTNIPRDTDLIWCFPAIPVDLIQKFSEEASLTTRRVVVLGSTSAYDTEDATDYPPPWIDETAVIDVSKPRVQGEEWLRAHCYSVVLRVAGIYGPGRSPITWMETGRVRPSRKYVNLIHVEDLATACLAALRHAQPGEAYNVSDGVPRTWNEICGRMEQHSVSMTVDQFARPGKRISNARLMELLQMDGVCLRHPDVLKTLAML